MAGLGFQEIISYSLTSLARLELLDPAASGKAAATLKVKNPMNEEHEYLRPTLRANLLSTLAENRRYEEDGIRLFEAGKVFQPRAGELPREVTMLCAVMSGGVNPPSWHGEAAAMDFYYAKGIVEGLLEGLGVTAEFKAGDDVSLHGAVQTKITVADSEVGRLGEVHPRVLDGYEITGPVFLFEFDVAALAAAASAEITFRPLPRFPAVTRDIALLVDKAVTHRQIADIISGFPLVVRSSVFDVYSGEQVTAGKKSTAYHIVFQSPDKTLTDEAVNAILKKILGRLRQELGAELRG